MSCFPLYDNLISAVSNRALTKDEKQCLIQNISKLDQDGHHKLLAIILFYQKQHGIKPYLEPASTVKVYLTSLPKELQSVLHMFCNLHINYMNELVNRDQNMDEQRLNKE